MTSENSYFVPPDRLSRRPRQDELFSADRQEFANDHLLAKAYELIEADYRLTPEQRQQAREKFQEIIDNLTLNAPVLLLSLSDGSSPEIVHAGYATSEAWLQDKQYDEWMLVLRYYEYNVHDRWAADTLRYSMWTFLSDVQNGATRLLVGEESVTAWLRSRSLATVRMEEPTALQFERDVALLIQMHRANMPIEYLGLTEEQRGQMGEWMVGLALKDDYRARHAYNTLEYVLGVETDQERQELYTDIASHLVEELPVSHDDTVPDRLLHVARSLARHLHIIEGQPTGVGLRETARQFMLLAHLYRLRSQMDYQPIEPLPEPQRKITTDFSELPPDHNLAMFTQDNPYITEIWHDIDYINYVKSPHAFGMTETRARTLSRHLHGLLMTVSLRELPPVFDALEVAFDAQDVIGRRRLYKHVLFALAHELPVQAYKKEKLERVAGLLEVMLPRLPQEYRDHCGYGLRGPAEVAAVIASMYEYRASFYIQADITRTGMDEDEDASAKPIELSVDA